MKFYLIKMQLHFRATTKFLTMNTKKQFLHRSRLHLSILFLSFIIYVPSSLNAQSTVTIDVTQSHQTIEGIGASDAWDLARIGKHWNDPQKEAIAELLFSREVDDGGQPKGIGLSMWRVNIGAGSVEQGDDSGVFCPMDKGCGEVDDCNMNGMVEEHHCGTVEDCDASGIKDKARRTECFLSPPAQTSYIIKNKASGKVLSVLNDSDANGENIVQVENPPFQIHGNEILSKYWNIEYLDNKYQITNVLTDFSMQVSADGSQIVQGEQGAASSSWLFTSDVNSFMQIVNSNSGEALTIAASEINNAGANAIQEPLQASDRFLWQIIPTNLDHFTYDWATKQIGHQYFAQQANNYGVEKFVAFSASPPVFFTKNGLATRINNEMPNSTNLQAHKFQEFSEFLVDVLDHYKSIGVDFDFISPINEPQYPWDDRGQEGSFWTNEEIARMSKELNNKLEEQNSTAKILLGEAGAWQHLYLDDTDHPHADNQIDEFFEESSPNFIGDLSHLPPIISAHSYFTTDLTTYPDNIITYRNKAFNKAQQYEDEYEGGLKLYQTEYSLLGLGHPNDYMEQALYLARVIHADMTEANVSSWCFWTAGSRKRYGHKNRFHLIDLIPEHGSCADIDKSGNHEAERTLWTLGNYSRFIRPEYTRVALSGANDYEGLMASAYLSSDARKLIAVFVNIGATSEQVNLAYTGPDCIGQITPYTTSQSLNLSKGSVIPIGATIDIPEKSIVTLDVDLTNCGSGCNSAAKYADPNQTLIASRFGMFTKDELVQNFINAEKVYIKYQAEINRILSSDKAQYGIVNKHFDELKDIVMSLLTASFVSEKQAVVSAEHLAVLDAFLTSLSKATNKNELREEIKNIRQFTPIMKDLELRDALIAFDRASVANMVIVPTLVQDKISIYYEPVQAENAQFSVIDINGKILHTYTRNNVEVRELHVNVEELATGVYFIKMTSGDIIITKKFVKQ